MRQKEELKRGRGDTREEDERGDEKEEEKTEEEDRM